MPNYAEAHNNLGNILKEQGKLKEAIACYRRALELNPKFAKVHLNLGDALKESGDFQGAEDCYRAALERDSRFTLAHYKLANFWAANFPRRTSRCSGSCWRKLSRRMRNDCFCTSAWLKSWRRGRVRRGGRATRSRQRRATIRVAQARPGI